MSSASSPLLPQDIVKKFQSRELSISTFVNEVIAQIKVANPKLNALVEERFDQALQEAKQKQVALEKGEVNFKTHPLWGLPMTIKEMLAVKGMRQTLGSFQRKDWISHQDATLVTRLKNLGAIIIGTTNVSELGFWFECANPVYGVTNNPFDVTRTSGGSSGGEGALVGAGLIPIGVGSDVGGSIRIPASFCGVSGYKPSPGVLPFTGHFPAVNEHLEAWQKHSVHMTCLGFLSNSVKDMAWITSLVMGPDPQDPSTQTPPISLDLDSAQVKTVYTLCDPDFLGAYRATSSIVTATQNSAKYLEALGFEVKPLPSDYFHPALKWWLARADHEKIAPFTQLMAPLFPINIFKQLTLKVFGQSPFEWPALLTGALEKLGEVAGIKTGDKFPDPKYLHKQHELTELLGDHSIILLPTHPRVAMRHGASLTHPFDFIYTGVANLFNLPAVQVPIAKDNHGMPIGCQILANTYQDRLALKAADILSQAFSNSSPRY